MRATRTASRGVQH